MKLTFNSKITDLELPRHVEQTLNAYPFSTVRDIYMRDVEWLKPKNPNGRGRFKGGNLMDLDDIGHSEYGDLRHRLVKSGLPDLEKAPGMLARDPHCFKN